MKAKKWIVISVSLLLLFSCCSVSAHPVAARASSSAVSVAAPDKDKILSAKFLNMLNHNFAYDEDFFTQEALVNAATVSLMAYADEDGFIPENRVAGYVRDFYGVEVEDFTKINAGFEQKNGYVFLIPRGFTGYVHSLVSAQPNEDGTYTVITRVRETGHDGAQENLFAKTLFVPDSGSSFGFHMVYSDLIQKMYEI